jgi:adenylate cyclase
LEPEGVQRKLVAILAADVVGYSRLASVDEDRVLARLRSLRSDLIDPTVAVNNGRVVKRTGDGAIVEFRSVVDAVKCAIEIQTAMAERNAEIPEDRRIVFRIGVHIGDVVQESDGDLMGDGVNIAARIEGICEPGGVCASEDAYRQVRDKISAEFEDLGDKELKNIARPIRVYQIISTHFVSADSKAKKPRLNLPEKPSIAVLPFQNMSGDPEQEYFAEGMVEDIITGLSRIKWLFVIARNSSFVYKGNAVDVRQVGRELGVRYVLEGGVRKSGNRLRITAQLLAAETGAHLWADKYDGALEDVFDLQDKITDQVVGIVEPSVQRSEIERARRTRPENLGAYDLYLRALPNVAAQMPKDVSAALPLLVEAVRLEPGYAAAHAYLAWSYELRFARGGLDPEDKAAALRHARAALTSGTDDATALAVAGFVSFLIGEDTVMALSAIDRALAVNPSCAMALFLGAQARALEGHSAIAIAYANRALRLSPFDPLAFQAHMAFGETALLEDRHDDAVACFSKASQTSPDFSTAYLFRAVALTLAGRTSESASDVGRLLELEPHFQIRVFTHWRNAAALKEKLVRGARLLGLPE